MNKMCWPSSSKSLPVRPSHKREVLADNCRQTDALSLSYQITTTIKCGEVSVRTFVRP